MTATEEISNAVSEVQFDPAALVEIRELTKRGILHGRDLRYADTFDIPTMARQVLEATGVPRRRAGDPEFKQTCSEVKNALLVRMSEQIRKLPK